MDSRRYRSSTASARSATFHPPIFVPGYARPTIHKPTLFFADAAPTAGPADMERARPRSITMGGAQWPYDASFSEPSRTSQTVPKTVQISLPPPPPPLPAAEARSRSAIDDTNQLQAASAMSRSESSRQETLGNLTTQEDEELAVALQESLRFSGLNSYSSSDMRAYNAEPGSSRDIVGPPPTRRPTARSEGTASSSWTQLSDDEAFARRLAAEDGSNASESVSSADEEFARQLAAEEEEQEQARLVKLPGVSLDEAYARILAAEEEIEKHRAEGALASPVPTITTHPKSLAYPNTTLRSAGRSSANGVEQSHSFHSADISLDVDAITYRNNPSGSTTSLLREADRTLTDVVTSPPPSAEASTRVSPTLESLVSSGEPNEDQMTSGGNHFVDLNLLRGVSIGFVTPAITPTLQPMQGVMPNIVSLPYGRSSPLHFMAPSWRHMLKLMARLSGSRIQPTVEALADNKYELHLRTVVQFIRPHPASMDWRTVIWFTIDHPVPPSIPGGRKYVNGDVEVLPWSYTLSTLPSVLQGNSETPISKTYTIPATDPLPYPKLPISFPNLALYLQAALDESRKYANDSSSGIRKLSRMMDQCYPTQERSDLKDQGERNGMGGLFRKAFGRGKNTNKQERGGNMDTYELVTPFVSDEWG